MTMPEGSTEEPEVIEVGHASLPVHVVSSDAKPVKAVGTEFGRWRSVLVANVVGPNSAIPGAQGLLNRSLRRHRANILVIATVVAQPVIDGVIVGSREQLISGMPAIPGQLGGFLPIGASVRYESQQELWVCYPSTNTNSVFVTVCDEVYAAEVEK